MAGVSIPGEVLPQQIYLPGTSLSSSELIAAQLLIALLEFSDHGFESRHMEGSVWWDPGVSDSVEWTAVGMCSGRVSRPVMVMGSFAALDFLVCFVGCEPSLADLVIA